jgi:hypothetical protein
MYTCVCTRGLGMPVLARLCDMRFRGDGGATSSSMSSSSGVVGASEISCNSPDTLDAKRAVPSQPGLVMVSSDHAPSGSTAAFFKESMRRDAMTGTKVVFTLRESWFQCQSFKGYVGVEGEGTYTLAGAELSS